MGRGGGWEGQGNAYTNDMNQAACPYVGLPQVMTV